MNPTIPPALVRRAGELLTELDQANADFSRFADLMAYGIRTSQALIEPERGEPQTFPLSPRIVLNSLGTRLLGLERELRKMGVDVPESPLAPAYDGPPALGAELPAPPAMASEISPEPAPAPAAPPPPPPAAAGEISPEPWVVWTEARKALLMGSNPSGQAAWEAALQSLNALPGPRIQSWNAVQVQHAKLRKSGWEAPPAPVLPPARPNSNATARATILDPRAAEFAEACELFAAGVGVRQVAQDMGISVDAAANYHGKWKVEQGVRA